MQTHPSGVLPQVLDLLEERHPKLGKRARLFVAKQDPAYKEAAEAFFARFAAFLSSTGHPLSDGIDSFLHLHESVDRERVQFLATGKYRNTSFDEVNHNFYGNDERMRRHMHGLVFAQFLWPDQYRRFEFFSQQLSARASQIHDYLEVGGGHALYVSEAARLLAPGTNIELVDISPTSMQMAQAIAAEFPIRYYLMDILDFEDVPAYDFITMGEIVEHLEDPLAMLQKMRRLLRPGGAAFISTPANSPMPDHIYQFSNADAIRQLIEAAGFRIDSETMQYSVDAPPELAERLKLSLMYAAFVSPR